jgi:PQQ-dependent dehydrogenase (methanol/ethanol family)
MNGLLPVLVLIFFVLPFQSKSQTDDGQWTQPAKDFQNTRFSSLDEINTTNASKLKVAWTFSTGVDRGQEAAPIVVSNLMFVVTPYPNIVYALDLTKPGSVKWKYEPKPSEAAQGVACCDVVNRGACYADGKIFFNTLDGYSICLDAQSGKELWRTQLGDINKGETITMAPLVAKGKVFVGNSGGEFGVRGWLTALDENSGKIAWRAYSTGPDSDCLISTNFHPFYPQNRGKDLGVSSWPPNFWQIGGGTVWGWVSYDPKSNLIFYGTANPGSWNPNVRPGDNLWTCGIFARDADTGNAKWFVQLNPHDLFDHDEINENILLDLPIYGTNEPVLIHPGRNGYMYVMDRNTGEIFSATPYVRITAAKGVDLKTGRIIMNEEKKPQNGKVIRDIQPASPGAKDWQPCAYSPRTKLLYVPHQNLSMDYEGTEANYIEGTPYLGVNVKMYAGPGGYRGEFLAWNILEKKPAWSIKENFPVWSGTLVTAGDVTFYGTLDGWFKAVNARTGEVLWKFKTGSGIIGQPVTYRGPDGKQYVAILSGIGGWVGVVVSGSLDVRDPTASLGFVNAVSDLPNATTKGVTLYVFSL